MIAHNAASRPAPLRRAMIADDSLLILLALEMLLEQHASAPLAPSVPSAS